MRLVHIFLAEDNPGDVFLVKEALREHHLQHELRVVKDGAEAIEFVAQMGKAGGEPCPDIILLDLNLPKADGYQVLKEFRKHPECACIPVIVVTSSDSQRDHEQARTFGIAHYFRKPSSFDEYMRLGAVVQSVLQTEPA